MKISDFKNFIKEFPHQNQSFDIKRENWKNKDQTVLINEIFQENNTITLNRSDLFQASNNLPLFAIKTLMWGYPTKGRGSNIDKLLIPDNFNQLITTLDFYKENNISINRLSKDIKEIEGLGLSTMSKFTSFLNTKIDGNRSVILDLQIIDAINLNRYEELNCIKGIRYDNAIKKYPHYLKVINNLSERMQIEPDQLEIFLFMFGKNLSEA